jgi:hypothetical protein
VLYKLSIQKIEARISMCEHMPIETLRAEKCNEEGDMYQLIIILMIGLT